jgi:serine/threonine protein kinase
MQTITAAEDSEMILAPNVPVLEKTQKKVTTLYSDFTLPEDLIKLLESKGYTIVEEIGHGSYGKVYKSMSNKQISEVAIKVVDIKRFSELFLKKFLNKEIELMKTLPTHPNVVTLSRCYVTLRDVMTFSKDQILENRNCND